MSVQSCCSLHRDYHREVPSNLSLSNLTSPTCAPPREDVLQNVHHRVCSTLHHTSPQDLHMTTAMKSEMEGNLSLFELTLPITRQTSSTIRLHLIHAGHLCFCKFGGLSTVLCEPVAFTLPIFHAICLLV